MRTSWDLNTSLETLGSNTNVLGFFHGEVGFGETKVWDSFNY